MKEVDVVRTRFEDFDKKAGGIKPGSLFVVASNTGGEYLLAGQSSPCAVAIRSGTMQRSAFNKV